MVSEVRFRDILCNDLNVKIMSDKISSIMGEKINLTLISKELPLPFDVVGLQLKYCDIVGIDEENNVYIIELKRRINPKSLISAEKQVNEYVETLKNTLNYIKDEKTLFYHHEILIRYFEYMNFDITKINKIIPIIISIENFDNTLIGNSSVHMGSIGDNLIDVCLKNFIKDKTEHFINTYNELISDLKINFQNVLEYAIKKQNIDTKQWFPVILNKTNFIGESKQITVLNSFKSTDVLHNYIIIFENINNYNKEYVDVTDKFESYLDSEFINQQEIVENQLLKNFNNETDDSNHPTEFGSHSNKFLSIPELYLQFSPEKIFERIYSYFKHADLHNIQLKFTIQLFRSGRTLPIIYLQIFENVYIPLMQTKPVVVSVGPSVNEIIAYDMKENFNENKNCFYQDVIALDHGTYDISLIESKGVKFYNIHLTGIRNGYEFQVYSPKFRTVKELLPYMSPEKVKDHLQNVINENGIDYLFKKTANSPTEWITSRIHLNKR